MDTLRTSWSWGRTAILALAAAVLGLLLVPAARAASTTFHVTTTADSGVGSLRQAIEDANANPGHDAIDFIFFPGSVITFTPLSPLPIVTDPVTIDGTTAPGYAGTPLFVIDGSAAVAEEPMFGLSIGAGDSTIRGLFIRSFAGGIVLFDGDGNIVQENRIGVAVDNPSGDYSQLGISVQATSNDNLIGGVGPDDGNDVIASRGILLTDIFGTVEDNEVVGNRVSGARHIGISLEGTDGSTVKSNEVTSERFGITVHAPADSVPTTSAVVAGNAVEVEVPFDPVDPFPDGAGISVGDALSTTVEDNEVSINQGPAIGIDGALTLVTGNRLGFADGIAVGNGGPGIRVGPSAAGVTLGGDDVEDGNAVVGSTIGIEVDVDASGVAIVGNTIGVNPGDSPLVNGVGISGGGEDGEIHGNTIEEHFGAAIDLPVVPDSDKVHHAEIRFNRIVGNNGPAISFGGAVPANDAGDVDSGPNSQQNRPVITGATFDDPDGDGDGQYTVHLTLDSAPGDSFRLDVYRNSECRVYTRDAAEHVAELEVANGNSTATFSGAAGGAFTATATNGDDETSPVSDCVTATAAAPEPPAEPEPPVEDPEHAPNAFSDDYTLAEDTLLEGVNVLDNDVDADGDELTAALVTEPEHGTAVLSEDGTLTYRPDADFSGTDAFTYRALDRGEVDDGELSTATVTITVTPVDEPPADVPPVEPPLPPCVLAGIQVVPCDETLPPTDICGLLADAVGGLPICNEEEPPEPGTPPVDPGDGEDGDPDSPPADPGTPPADPGTPPAGPDASPTPPTPPSTPTTAVVTDATVAPAASPATTPAAATGVATSAAPTVGLARTGVDLGGLAVVVAFVLAGLVWCGHGRRHAGRH